MSVVDLIIELEDEIEKRKISHPARLSKADCWSLYRFLEHGNREHCHWLVEAIFKWSLGKPKPPVRGLNAGTVEQRIKKALEGVDAWEATRAIGRVLLDLHPRKG